MTKQYEKFLKTLDASTKHHFLKAIQSIAQDDFSGQDIKKLGGFPDLYRIRIGKRRIIFRRGIADNTVLKIESR